MKFVKIPLSGAYILKTEPFVDHRGTFSRLFCKKELRKVGLKKGIVQTNLCYTRKKASIRGMHYQIPPCAEIKIVKVAKGSIFDVIVDVRRDSPTFLKWYGCVLSEDNAKMLYIPEGFAHGYQSLEDNTEILYFVTGYYRKEKERSIRYNEPLIRIRWPIKISSISEKDKLAPLLKASFKGVAC